MKETIENIESHEKGGSTRNGKQVAPLKFSGLIVGLDAAACFGRRRRPTVVGLCCWIRHRSAFGCNGSVATVTGLLVQAVVHYSDALFLA